METASRGQGSPVHVELSEKPQCQVVLLDWQSACARNELLRGIVTVKCMRPIFIRDIVASLEGTADFWIKRTNYSFKVTFYRDSVTVFPAEELLFPDRYKLIGTYEYPFTLRFPNQICPSFNIKTKDYSLSVAYRVSAVINPAFEGCIPFAGTNVELSQSPPIPCIGTHLLGDKFSSNKAVTLSSLGGLLGNRAAKVNVQLKVFNGGLQLGMPPKVEIKLMKHRIATKELLVTRAALYLSERHILRPPGGLEFKYTPGIYYFKGSLFTCQKSVTFEDDTADISDWFANEIAWCPLDPQLSSRVLPSFSNKGLAVRHRLKLQLELALNSSMRTVTLELDVRVLPYLVHDTHDSSLETLPVYSDCPRSSETVLEHGNTGTQVDKSSY